MPLVKSGSKEAVSENIRREMSAGKPQKQAVAIALDVQRRAKRSRLAVGGIPDVSQGNWWNHQQGDPVIAHGPVPGDTPGRADAFDASVPAGSYVLPADVVSALGQGNTSSGVSYLDRIFSEFAPGLLGGLATGANPAELAGGLLPALAGGRGKGIASVLGGALTNKFAAGGVTPKVPVALSGGEYVVNPQAAAAVGEGNLRHGHQILDAFVKHVRGKHVKTLSKLPGPVK